MYVLPTGAVLLQELLRRSNQLAVPTVLGAVRSVGDHADLDDVAAGRLGPRSPGGDPTGLARSCYAGIEALRQPLITLVALPSLLAS